jgi:HlyD family secretion protein
MDRPRPAAAGSKRKWPVATAVLVVACGAVLLLTFRSPVHAVERDRVVIDVVKRGPFLHEIAAPGALAAEQVRLVAAPAAGRIEEMHVKAGDAVRRGDPIVTLANREAMKELLEIEQQVAVAEADLADLSATLQARSLESEKMLRRTEFEKRDTARQAEATGQLAREGLAPQLEAVRASEAADETAQRVESERGRHLALQRSATAQIEAQRNRIERLRALHDFQRGIVDGLVVRTPADAVVREMTVQEGEWVTEGYRLARLVEPGRLKAVLNVPESTALDVRPGQRVTMNARGMRLRGTVDRVAATVESGSVAVEVRLEGNLPDSLRPDLSVDARVEIARASNVLTITRPAHATANRSARLYRLDDDGHSAKRVEVRFGAASVDRIVILAGAAEGERLIISGTEEREEPVIRLD